MKMLNVGSIVLSMLFFSVTSSASAEVSREQARAAMHKAVQFFQKEVSASGGYLWTYSSDLKEREGEESATATQAWVQPPGTPSVGDAFLEAYLLTGDEVDNSTQEAIGQQGTRASGHQSSRRPGQSRSLDRTRPPPRLGKRHIRPANHHDQDVHE